MNLCYQESDKYFEFQSYMALTLEGTQTFLANKKNYIKIYEARNFKGQG